MLSAQKLISHHALSPTPHGWHKCVLIGQRCGGACCACSVLQRTHRCQSMFQPWSAHKCMPAYVVPTVKEDPARLISTVLPRQWLRCGSASANGSTPHGTCPSDGIACNPGGIMRSYHALLRLQKGNHGVMTHTHGQGHGRGHGPHTLGPKPSWMHGQSQKPAPSPCMLYGQCHEQGRAAVQQHKLQPRHMNVVAMYTWFGP